MTAAGQDGDGTVAAVLRLADLAARIERVDADSIRRIEELARDCADAMQQIAGLRDELGTIGTRTGEIERRLTEVSDLLDRMAGQIGAVTAAPGGAENDGPAYRVNPAPPWWKPGDPMREDTVARLRDWVSEVYRPVFGYLGNLLAPCWDEHPLCLAYLDTIHEAWCLLYIPARDPKMVFAQLDWLTRPLLQAAEVMAAETRACRDRGSHREPGQAPALSAVPRYGNGRS